MSENTAWSAGIRIEPTCSTRGPFSRHRLRYGLQTGEGVAEHREVDAGPVPLDEEGLEWVAAEGSIHVREPTNEHPVT